MINEELQKLEAYILKYNTYFTESFYNASQSPFTGYIQVGDDPVFPNDTLGNYFYLRMPNFMQFDDSMLYLHAEGDARVGIRMPLTVVACVRNADPVILLENLITTLRQYMPNYVRFQNATHQKEIVIVQELGKLPQNEIKDAISKVDMDYTIVSINFLFTFPYLFQELECIQMPC